jgi:uncharacterized membrane protein
MVKRRSNRTQFLVALGFATLVSIGLFAYNAWHDHTVAYSYLIWNLFLAWLPLLFAGRLISVLRYKLWSSWEGLAWSVLWLIFFPNSFYMVSDFIHLQDVAPSEVLYYVVMFSSFIYTAVILGFCSLYLIHLQMRRRLPPGLANFCVLLLLFICSVGIYIGRDLRWNSWNVLTNPGGLLFDVSDRLQHPSAYPQMILVIITFFVLQVSMYGLLWRGIRLVRHPAETVV